MLECEAVMASVVAQYRVLKAVDKTMLEQVPQDPNTYDYDIDEYLKLTFVEALECAVDFMTFMDSSLGNGVWTQFKGASEFLETVAELRESERYGFEYEAVIHILKQQLSLEDIDKVIQETTKQQVTPAGRMGNRSRAWKKQRKI